MEEMIPKRDLARHDARELARGGVLRVRTTLNLIDELRTCRLGIHASSRSVWAGTKGKQQLFEPRNNSNRAVREGQVDSFTQAKFLSEEPK